MFLKTLRAQSTDEQRELFLKPAENYEIIGCYAQVRPLSTSTTIFPPH